LSTHSTAYSARYRLQSQLNVNKEFLELYILYIYVHVEVVHTTNQNQTQKYFEFGLLGTKTYFLRSQAKVPRKFDPPYYLGYKPIFYLRR
jgi:hypothetical protein